LNKFKAIPKSPVLKINAASISSFIAKNTMPAAAAKKSNVTNDFSYEIKNNRAKRENVLHLFLRIPSHCDYLLAI